MSSRIQEWYAGKTILITGATGFMGKVLLEKILRDLQDVDRVFVLVRPKRGVDAESRLMAIRSLPIFDRLRIQNPNGLTKINTIEGNLDEKGLGLSEADVKRLEDVNVVFHMAATLRLEAEVKDAVIANTLGTLMLLELCKGMKNLDCFVHLSTAFCYPDRESLDEQIYEPHRDPYEIIKYVQTESDSVLKLNKNRIIAPHPNSYTFSKRLAEWVVKDFAQHFPVVIARPSIVIPSFREPMKGWVDSLNGPIGVIAAAGKGVLRSMLCEKANTAQIIPCDLAINALITIPTRRAECEQDVATYNINIPKNVVSITWGEVLDIGQRVVRQYPFSWMLWYPDGELRTNYYIHWMVLILFQWIPAILLDMIFFLVGRERFMVRVQKKIMVGLDVLQYFTTREWHFDTANYEQLCYKTVGRDEEIFYHLNVTYDIVDYLTQSLLVVKKHIFKEKFEYLPYLRIYHTFLWLLHNFVKYALLYMVAMYFIRTLGLDNFIRHSKISTN